MFVACILVSLRIPGLEKKFLIVIMSLFTTVVRLRPHFYCIPHKRQPSLPRDTLAKVTLSLFLCKVQPTIYIRIVNPSWGSELSRLGRSGKWDNSSSYKHFRSPNWDNSRHDEWIFAHFII